jgi:hypothetical protein
MGIHLDHFRERHIAVVIDDARLKRLKPTLRVGQVDIDQLV